MFGLHLSNDYCRATLKLFVDLYNVEIDVEADTYQKQGAMSFRMRLPLYKNIKKVEAITTSGNFALQSL